MKTIAPLILVLFCVVACGGADQRPESTGFFATYIEDDGTKKFQYTMDSPFSRPRNGSRGGTAGSGASSSHGVSTGVSVSTASGPTRGSQVAARNLLDEINQDLETQLEKSLRETRFCRDGYRETGRVIEREMLFVRGQCKDLANDEDRARFSDG